MHLPGAHVLKSCTRRPKCAHWVQGAPLISNTAKDISKRPALDQMVTNLLCFLFKRRSCGDLSERRSEHLDLPYVWEPDHLVPCMPNAYTYAPERKVPGPGP